MCIGPDIRYIYTDFLLSMICRDSSPNILSRSLNYHSQETTTLCGVNAFDGRSDDMLSGENRREERASFRRAYRGVGQLYL